MATEAEKRAAKKYRESEKGKNARRAWKDRNREKVRKWKREWASSEAGKRQRLRWYKKSPSAMFNLYKKSAQRRGLKFEINIDDFISMIALPCSYCGAVHNRNGLDRIDNDQGYVMDNLAPCCTACNQMKGKRSVSEFIYHVTCIAMHQEEGD